VGELSVKRRFFPARSESRLRIIRLWWAQVVGHMVRCAGRSGRARCREPRLPLRC
jgi:hypothetical protein